MLGPGAEASRPASSAVRELRSCGTGSSRHRRLHLPTRADDACAMTPGDGLVDQRVRAVTVGSDGRVRVGTVSALHEIEGAHITSVSHAQGLVDDPINAVTEDRDGNLWIATDASGALRIAAFGLVSYFRSDGLRSDFVPSLFEDDAGRVIAVSATRFSISEFDGRRFVKTRFNVPRHVPDTRYFTVLRDHLGAWWLGTPMGLYRFPPTGRIADVARVTPDAHYARLPGLPSDDLYPLFEDRRGDIWLIALLPDQARLVRWRRASDDFTPYGASEGLGPISPEWTVSRPAIVESPNGQLFFGFRDVGLFAYRDGRFESILDRGKPIAVISLHLDRLGRLWIAGPDGTVRRLDNLSTRRLTTDTKVTRSLIRCERPVHGRGRQRSLLLWNDERSHRSRSSERRHVAIHDGRWAGAERSVECPRVPARRPLVRDHRRSVAPRDDPITRQDAGSAGADQDGSCERRHSSRVGARRRGDLGADAGAQRARDRH